MELFWGIFLRTGQIAIEASSTLFVGFLVAAILRRMLGSEGTRKLFGGSGFKGLFRAWFIGSLLPVCSLGVIPVVREMRRAGVPSSTILSFVLAAPHLNPLSFLYGLTLSEPIVIISYVVATMVIAIAGGELWKHFFEKPEDTPMAQDEPLPGPGLRRLLFVLVSAGRDIIGISMGYALIGILFTGILAGSLPYGCLSTTMGHTDPLSPLLMLALGLPAYSGVLPGMMRIGLMFDHGNSVGAAFVLFEIGVGLNLGLIVWLLMHFGLKRMLPWLLLICAITVGIGYAMEYPLYFPKEETSHTHAFDEWASPFPSGTSPDFSMVKQKLIQKLEVLEPVAIVCLAVLALMGWISNSIGTERVDRWMLTRAPETENGPASMWNRHVPGPVLGLVALLMLVVFSVVALYIYYPDREQSFAEMIRVRADAMVAVRGKKKEEAIRQIQQWDLITRKLQVGVFLRTWKLPDEQAKASDELREALEVLRDHLLADEMEEAVKYLPEVEKAFQSCKQAFRADE